MNMYSYKCCQTDSSEFNQIGRITDTLQLISEPNRLKLLCLLRQQSHCVCEILAHFDMSQSLVSHHLADLRHADLVHKVKVGRKVIYSLSAQGLQLTESIFRL